ncbi:hypothetical protein HS088_TW21G00765 [Tripterygium wilfordii]|uniref:Uncharacterized protein n=1 Tax=Tripterygium wilfordii TaxID=458696 RepID=A0A7J7C444_TRIWF|nr:hypothetical protein HS088_TW21G00765 [Tripterygium wilfordii]
MATLFLSRAMKQETIAETRVYSLKGGKKTSIEKTLTLVFLYYRSFCHSQCHRSNLIGAPLYRRKATLFLSCILNHVLKQRHPEEAISTKSDAQGFSFIPCFIF